MNNVLTLSRKVKAITESPSERTIVNTFFFCASFPAPVRDPPTMTGSNGKIHGASTVSTPAINDTRRRNILFYVCYEVSKCWTS